MVSGALFRSRARLISACGRPKLPDEDFSRTMRPCRLEMRTVGVKSENGQVDTGRHIGWHVRSKRNSIGSVHMLSFGRTCSES